MKNKKDDEKVTVMIGGGDQSIFIKVKKGTKVYIGDGLWQEAGLTLEESKKRVDKRMKKTINEIKKEQRRENVKQKVLSLFKRKN